MRYLSGPCGLDYIIDLSCDGAAVLCDGSPGFHAHYGGRRDYESRSGLTVGGWIPDRGELIPADSIRWDIGRPLDIDCSATWQRPVVLYEFSAVGCCRKECRGCDGDCRCKGGCCRNGAFAVLVQPQWLGYRNHEDVHFVICDRLADIPDGLPGEPKTFRVGRYRVVEPIDTVAVVQAARLVWEEREVRVLDYRQPGGYPSTWAIVQQYVVSIAKFLQCADIAGTIFSETEIRSFHHAARPQLGQQNAVEEFRRRQ